MNLHLMRIFAAVAEHHSFSRAAGSLFISQPAVTKSVQEFERTIGVALIDRSRRTLTLTEAGVAVLAHAQRILAEERLAEAELDEIRAGLAGSLAIGASTTIGIYMAPEIMGRFHVTHPQVKLFLDIGNTHDILGRLHTVPLHFALVEGPVADETVTVAPWRVDTLVVIAAPQHPLARQPSPPLAEVVRQPFILRELGSGTREVVAQAFLAKGITVPIAMELGSTEAIKRAVGAGLGLAIVSAETIADDVALGRICVLKVPELTIQRELRFITLPGRQQTPVQEAFIQLLMASGEGQERGLGG